MKAVKEAAWVIGLLLVCAVCGPVIIDIFSRGVHVLNLPIWAWKTYASCLGICAGVLLTVPQLRGRAMHLGIGFLFAGSTAFLAGFTAAGSDSADSLDPTRNPIDAYIAALQVLAGYTSVVFAPVLITALMLTIAWNSSLRDKFKAFRGR